MSAKILNGDINVFDLEAKDTYLKSTNGDLMIDGFTATMLEAKVSMAMLPLKMPLC